MRSILFLVLVIFYSSCSSPKKQSDESDSFEELTTIDESIDESAINGSMILFCKSNNLNKIGYTYLYAVIKNYRNDPQYSQLEYKTFISNIINSNLILNFDDIQYFNINDTIKYNYDNSNFSEFLLKHSNNNINESYYFISNNISFNSQLTVIYYLYLNHYYTMFDDLSGFYYSRKVDDFSDQLINLDLDNWQ